MNMAKKIIAKVAEKVSKKPTEKTEATPATPKKAIKMKPIAPKKEKIHAVKEPEAPVTAAPQNAKKSIITPIADREVLCIEMARYYLSRKNITHADVAKKFNVSDSTVSRWFKNYLATYNQTMYEKVQAKYERVKSDNQKKFVKNPKVKAKMKK